MTAGLLGRLGGGRTSQVKDLLDDFKLLSQRAETGAGSISGLGLAAEALGGPLGIVAAGLTAGAVAAGIFLTKAFELAKWASDYGSQLQDLSQRTGIAVEDQSIWKVAVETTGGSLQSVNTALGQYIRKVADANHGNKEAAKDFKQIGINAKEAYESPQAAIAALVNRTNQLSNEEDRLLLLRKAGVRNAEQVNAAISEMGGTYEEFRKKVAAAGLIITSEQARAADEFGDRLKYVELQLKALAFTAGSEFFPPFRQGMDALKTDLALLGPLTRDWAQITAGGLTLALSMLKPYVDQIAIAVHLLESVPQIQMLKSIGAAQAGQARIAGDFMAGIDAANRTVQGALGGAGRLGDKAGRAGSGESAARKAAQQALESARIDLREAESVYALGNQIERRALDINLRDFQTYINNRLKLEEQRHKAVQAGLEAEKAAASTLPKQGERELKLKDINQREAQEAREFENAKVALKIEGQQKLLAIENAYIQKLISVNEAGNAAIESAMREGAARGIYTYREVAEQELKNTIDLIEQETERLKLLFVQAGGVISESGRAMVAEGIGKNADRQREILQDITISLSRRTQAEVEGVKKVRDARADDIADAQRHASTLRSIYAQVSDINASIMQSQLDAMGESQFNRGATIEAQRVLDRAMETARSARTRAGLFEQRRQQDVNPNRSDAVQIVKAINAQIEAEERLHQQRLIDIDRKASEERRRQLVELADDIAGILTTGLEQFDGTWDSLWRGMLDQALSVIRQIAAELMKMSFEGLLTGQTRGSGAGGLVGSIANLLGGALLGGFGGRSIGGVGSGAAGVISGLGYATGTMSATPGWHLVGERGIEAVNFRGGERVLNNTDTRKMLGGQTTINHFNFNLTYKDTPASYTRKKTPNQVASRLLRGLRGN